MNMATIAAATSRIGSALTEPSLTAAHRSIPVADVGSGWRKLLSFLGPGVLVAVGYMDPGNWATSLAGGSHFGYTLLSVVLLSNAMAMLFQAAAVRLGIGAGIDLAQACRQHFSPRLAFVLWVLCELAIIACNLAEVIGMAIGLNLLFSIPLLWGVAITFIDVMLILALQSFGFRYLEAVVFALVSTVGACFALQVIWLHPPLASVVGGFLPRSEIVTNPEMLYLAVGIVGATVMPHNLYLHSAVVQTRRHERSPAGVREAIRFATFDSNLALSLALFVNAAILIVSAGAFHGTGGPQVAELADAYRLMSPQLGIGVASLLFGIALVCSGLSSSVTGTLAGQIVMDGFLNIRVPPVLRALVTRSVAIVPAVIAIAIWGGSGANGLLVFSQVFLGLQLPFALLPLLYFTTSRKRLGEFAFGPASGALLWTAAATVVALNVWLLQRLLLA